MHQPLSPRLELSDEAWDDVGRECGGWEWIDGEKQSGGRNELGGRYFSLSFLFPLSLRSRKLELVKKKTKLVFCGSKAISNPFLNFFYLLNYLKKLK